MMWEASRETVIKNFPKAPGLPKEKKEYLRDVDEIYQSDAYHSLSIEGYSVSAELIEGVRQGEWNPDQNAKDRKDRDALAARGYWQAFQAVKQTIEKVLGGANSGALARAEHKDWYARAVPALRDGGPAPRGGAGGIPQECRIPANVALCTATVVSGARRNARVLRSS
jgi:hypothetical protein